MLLKLYFITQHGSDATEVVFYDTAHISDAAEAVFSMIQHVSDIPNRLDTQHGGGVQKLQLTGHGRSANL